MTVTLKLKPEVEAGLLTQAQASGMTLEEYLLSLVEGAGASKSTSEFVGGRARSGVRGLGRRPSLHASPFGLRGQPRSDV
jgi:hypothetical protein